MPPGGVHDGGPPGHLGSGGGRPGLRALALYLGAALLVAASALPDPLHLALGSPANDVWNHLWGHDWVYRELRRGELPVHTEELGWPEGGALWYIDSFGALLSLPVRALLGPVAAYNATIVGNLVFAGLAADLLARRVGAGPRGALVAGMGFLLTPHVLAQIYNGVSEATSTGWLPLGLALALRAWQGRPMPAGGPSRGGPGDEAGRVAALPDALLAGLAWGLGAAASAYVGVWIGLCLLVLLPFLPKPPRRAALVPLGLGLGLLLAAAAPLGLFAHTLRAADALVKRDPAFVWSTLLDHNRTDLVALVRPFRWYSPDLRLLFHEELIIVVYTGAALWLPALALCAADLRRRRGGLGAAPAWATLGLVFTVLSLGPFLYVGGEWVKLAGGQVPLPYYALFRWVPGFTAVSHPYRFAVGTSLALCVSAGLGVARLEASGWGWVRARAGSLAGAWILARAVESLLLSPAVWPLPVAEVRPVAAMAWIDELEGADPPAAVLDLPLGLGPLERSAPLLAQIGAGGRVHPVPFALNDPLPERLAANHYTRYLGELERRRSLRLPEALPLLDLAAGARELRALGLRWIVVHREVYGPEAWARVRPFLELTASLRREGEGQVLYELTPPGGTARSATAASTRDPDAP